MKKIVVLLFLCSVAYTHAGHEDQPVVCMGYGAPESTKPAHIQKVHDTIPALKKELQSNPARLIERLVTARTHKDQARQTLAPNTAKPVSAKQTKVAQQNLAEAAEWEEVIIGIIKDDLPNLSDDPKKAAVSILLKTLPALYQAVKCCCIRTRQMKSTTPEMLLSPEATQALRPTIEAYRSLVPDEKK